MTLALYTATRQFAVTTTRCDRTRAYVRIGGCADPAGAEILQAVLEGHIRAGRRYLRVDTGAASTLDEAALLILSEVHHRLLAVRGTLIITAVSGTLAQLLAAVDPSLLVLPVNVSDGVVSGGVVSDGVVSGGVASDGVIVEAGPSVPAMAAR